MANIVAATLAQFSLMSEQVDKLRKLAPEKGHPVRREHRPPLFDGGESEMRHAAWGTPCSQRGAQASFKSIDEISDEEWELTFKVNIHAIFYLTKVAVAHMKPGSCIINTASINSDAPNPTRLAYATTKGAIHNFTAGLAQMLAEKGIRANAVAPGPIWTPLIPSTLPEDSVKNFGKQVRGPGQPVELATAYVMLADPLSSYVSGATIAVTGGKPFL